MASEEYKESEISKKVKELMDDGYEFGEAVREALKEGFADGGSIGIEVLFGPKRQNLFMGGPALEGPALGIYNSMKAYQSFTDQEIADAIRQAGYELPTADSGTTPPGSTPQVVNQLGYQGGNEGQGGIMNLDPYNKGPASPRNQSNNFLNTAFSKVGDFKDSMMDKFSGTKIGEGIISGASKFKNMAFTPMMALANMRNPLNPNAQNYNPSLQGQIDMLGGMTGSRITGTSGNLKTTEGLAMLGRDPNSGLGKYGPGSVLAGQNVVSGFGTNDYEDQLQGYIDKMLDRRTKGVLTEFQQAKLDAAKAELERARAKEQARIDELNRQKIEAKKIEAKKIADAKQAARERDQAARAKKLNPEVYANRQENDGRSSFGNQTAEEQAYGSCFIAGTKVTMADGTFKNIEDIKVGDKVKGHKENNEVIKLDPTLLGNRKLYSFNDNEHYFFTSEHPFMTEEGWKSIKPEKTKERDGVELYNQLKGELKVGDKLVTDNGSIEITDIKSKEMNSPEMPLYNFNISNDNSYIADNYIVHNKGGSGGSGGGIGGMGAGMCFDPSTPIQMADGSTKEIKDIQLGDDTKGGEVTGVFQFKAADEIHDYKGVTVAGSHFVKEDGKFIMVKDSPLSVKIDKIPVVYSLDTTGRRIFINDIEFADYNGDGVAKNFLTNAGVDLTGFDTEVLRQVEHRLI